MTRARPRSHPRRRPPARTAGSILVAEVAGTVAHLANDDVGCVTASCFSDRRRHHSGCYGAVRISEPRNTTSPRCRGGSRLPSRERTICDVQLVKSGVEPNANLCAVGANLDTRLSVSRWRSRQKVGACSARPQGAAPSCCRATMAAYCTPTPWCWPTTLIGFCGRGALR